MEPFAAIKYVTSGITLAAFIVAVVAWAYRSKLTARKQTIKEAPAKDRAALIERTLDEWFAVSTQNLTKEQQYALAVRQIDARANRFRIGVRTSLIVFCIAALVTLILLLRGSGAGSPSKVSSPGDRLPSTVEVVVRVQDEAGNPVYNKCGVLSNGNRRVGEVCTGNRSEFTTSLPPGDYDLEVDGAKQTYPLKLIGPSKQEFDIRVSGGKQTTPSKPEKGTTSDSGTTGGTASNTKDNPSKSVSGPTIHQGNESIPQGKPGDQNSKTGDATPSQQPAAPTQNITPHNTVQKNPAVASPIQSATSTGAATV